MLCLAWCSWEREVYVPVHHLAHRSHLGNLSTVVQVVTDLVVKFFIETDSEDMLCGLCAELNPEYSYHSTCTNQKKSSWKEKLLVWCCVYGRKARLAYSHLSSLLQVTHVRLLLHMPLTISVETNQNEIGPHSLTCILCYQVTCYQMNKYQVSDICDRQ